MKPILSVTPQTALLFVVAHASARRLSVPEGDRDDSVIAFLEHVWQEQANPEITLTPRSLAYWRRAADNWMKNALRDDLRQRRREGGWPHVERADGQFVAFEPPDRHPGPDGEAFREELRRLFARAMEELTPEQKECLLRHVVNGETYKAIAEDLDRTPDAVRKSVSRALAHLRSYLERHGFDEKEAEDYLAMMSPPPPPANVAFPTIFRY